VSDRRHFALDFRRKRSMNGAHGRGAFPNRLAPLTPPAPLASAGFGWCGALLRRHHAEEFCDVQEQARAVD